MTCARLVTCPRFIGATVVLLLLVAAPAAANLRDSKGNFVFGGKHYEERSFKDPTLGINVIFRGGSPATSGRVAFHLAHGYIGWGKRSGFKDFNCGGARYVPFPSPDRRNVRWAAPSMQGTTNPRCFKQRHARFFNDRRHSEQWNHDTTGDFLLAQVHRETVVYKPGLLGCPSGTRLTRATRSRAARC